MADDAGPVAGGLWLLDVDGDRCVTDHLRSADIATGERGATYYYLVGGRVYEVWIEAAPAREPAVFFPIPYGVEMDCGEECGLATVPPARPGPLPHWLVPMRWDAVSDGWLFVWEAALKVDGHG